MLELVDVNTYYGAICVLRGVSLTVKDGAVVALLGRNGMGKTTTVNSIIGFTPPRSGTIKYNGTEITRLPSYQIASMGIALVPQGRRIFPSLSVEENLLLGMRGRKGSLDMAYSYFPILKDRAKNRGNQLSGGEQQMLSLARVLLAHPKLILMDEPSEGLAPQIIHMIGDIILDLKKQGISILLVEQNITLALKVSDYVYILHKGQIVYDCNTQEFACDQKIQDEFIGVARLAKRGAEASQGEAKT